MKKNKQISTNWIWQGAWNDCKHNLKVDFGALSAQDLVFKCAKCKWYFRYVSRLEPWFQPNKKEKKNLDKQE